MDISFESGDDSNMVRVVLRAGHHARVPREDLLPNVAMDMWRRDRNRTLRECDDNGCNPNACRFVHFLVEGDRSSGTRAQDAPTPNAVFVSPFTAQERRALIARIQSLAPGWPHHRHLSEGRQGGPALCNTPLTRVVQSDEAQVRRALLAQIREDRQGGPALCNTPLTRVVQPDEAQVRRALIAQIQLQARRLSERRRHLREGRQGGPALCNICCEERAASDVYTCDGRHTSCSTCLASFILLNWRSLGALHGTRGAGRARVNELRCCHPSCTSNPIPPATVLQLVTQKDALAVYVEQLQRMSAAQAFGEAHAIVAAEAPQAAAEALLLKQLQLSMSHARMCPRCKHGPVDFAGCADLALHHMEGHAHGGRTSNACRQCGFFARNVREWEYWDGVIRNEPQRATPAPHLSQARDTHSILRPARAVLHFIADRPPMQFYARPEHTPPVVTDRPLMQFDARREHTPPVVTDRPLMQFYARPEHTPPPSRRHHDEGAQLIISAAVAMVADILPYADVQWIHQACSDAVASHEHLRNDPAAVAASAMDSLLG